MQVLLIHGQGRTTFSMRLLGGRLRRLGYHVQYFGYSTRQEAFAEITERLTCTLRALCTGGPCALVGHSLGGVLARASLPALGDRAPSRLVMLAPPNQPPLLARRLQRHPVYQYLTRDCGQKLASTAFYERLARPTIPTTIIAGTGGPRGPWLPFGHELNDGVVSVQETWLGPEHEVILVPCVHTFIMNSPLVLHHIDRALRQGDSCAGGARELRLADDCAQHRRAAVARREGTRTREW